MIEALLERFDFDAALAATARRAVARTDSTLRAGTNARVRASVLRAFLDEGLTDADLASTLGYGYDDAARERYEALLARIFGAERALARLSFASGTHAIVTAIDACLPRDGRLVSATGRPYDTLHNALVEAPHSLVRRGARYEEIAFDEAGDVDLKTLAASCERGADVVFVQRSRGYAPRRSLSSLECGAIARTVRAVAPQAFVLVDNCYSELVEATEPTHHGVDAVMGSLIKNLGGGLAPGGGYVIGRADVVERVAARHYAPGLGSALGSSLGFGRSLVQGLFYAPLLVDECLAGLDLAAALFTELGERVDPLPGARRSDIVQAIGLGSVERLSAFARGLQHAMPLNARFEPQPGPVPGYRDPVIMSGGAFVSGATLELSCDAPLRPPFEVYLQGGTSREHVLLGALFAAKELAKEANVLRRRTMRNTHLERSIVSDSSKDTALSEIEAIYRRRYVRVALSGDVSYTRDGDELAKTGHASDVGGGGLRLATDEDLPLGGAFLLRFPLPGIKREIAARGRIVLSFYNAEDRQFYHGIAFTSIDPKDQQEIVKYVAVTLQQSTVDEDADATAK